MPAQKAKKTILIIDDDKIFCQSIKEYLEKDPVEVIIANTGKDGLSASARGDMDIILLDQRLPDVEGDTLCGAILANNDHAKIIFITAHASFEGAVKAMKSGAFNYLSKPFELEELDLAIEQALRTTELERIEQLQKYRTAKESKEAVLIGGQGLSGILKLLESASSSEAPVLITGETGTGKNVLAKAIHYKSPLRKAPFISINCAALPENLMESELFGYEKGAFTGAVASKKSIFEMAEGGTLFLDEIGEIPLHLQAKLLGAIEEKKIRRLGSESVKSVNVRIIAATGRELEKELGEAFRKDLYYRLSVIRIHMPPLRERKSDMRALCDYFLSILPGGREMTISGEELEKLSAYPWPGNIRELKNVIERALILQRGMHDLRPSDLLVSLEKSVAGNPELRGQQGFFQGDEILTLAEIEKNYIKHSLARLYGNYTKTSRALGISLSTLKRKLKEYDLK
ncbi:MAG: sigma-54 dependent transcriptional regulator [Actinomycetota bacterium]|nr:sigma-54 dependent transcriptional regulator [Actinomycetota bacterium]